MAQGSIGQALRIASHGNHPMRTILLDLLSKRQFSSYKQLTEAAATIAEQVELGKKEVEKEVRTSLLAGAKEDLSAVQKQNLEKEIEGAASTHAAQEAHALFEIMLAWYRDMHLLSVNGDCVYLMHRDYRDVCQQALQYGNILSIEAVQKAVAEAQLALARSTSLQICFENLFLKLNLI